MLCSHTRRSSGLILLWGLIAASLLCFCSRKELPEPAEQILAKIGDRTISVEEFLRRAEYTIRPPYCRGSHNLDKKIILNSLIAEKLMSIEASDTNSFITSNRIQLYLRGRQEQLMRQWLYETEALSKVVIDTVQARKTLQVVGRKYKISYFNLPDSHLIQKFQSEVRQGRSFEDAYFELTRLDTLPRREVEWSLHEHDLILDSLFAQPLKKNQVLGPVRIGDGQHLLLKIDGWIDRPAITEALTRERWRNITDKFTQRASAKLYDNYILKVMHGKKIDFNPEVFYTIADRMLPVYFKTDAEKIEVMQNSYWEKDEADPREDYLDLQRAIENSATEPLFKVDGRAWTVQDFADELVVHPLVFRNQRMKKNEFGQELQFAIMDLVCDRYLADVAYQRGYDKIKIIQRNVTMFQDNLNYQYQKAKYLRSVVPDTVREMNYMPLIENYLNPYVDSLQSRYTHVIEIDVEAFDALKLTRIDLSVSQKNVPYPKVVPSFPLVTTDNRLEYGRKMAPSGKP